MATFTYKQQIQQKWKKSEKEHKNDSEALHINQSLQLQGQANLLGAKNAVLVMIASLILTEGKSTLRNVPASSDVLHMIGLLKELGAEVLFNTDEHTLEVDTSFIRFHYVRPEIMKKMRASILVMGPLLARFGKAEIALPGGCLIGSRPVDFHLKNFLKMGVAIHEEKDMLYAQVKQLEPAHIVLEYPSVGATENITMAAVLTPGKTTIINASLEPEVMELITVLKKMGALITIHPPATIEIEGVSSLHPIEHEVLVDRLEAGALLLAAAITGGSVHLPNACYQHLDVFLLKLEEMGHAIQLGADGIGITLHATMQPKAVSLRTAPYPGFPTDLQAPMMAALALAEGKSVIHETVFENRFLHIPELKKMGAQITLEGDRAYITGVEELYGTHVIAADIRASCALVLAGLAAKGTTIVTGVRHWKRGYDALDKKLQSLGAQIFLKTGN
ncbi:MAG: UDP-N-acetylglucosamine 1-carboxyvinyltransferase [Candidatus Babeliales bacterium]